jgi:hypothetical protein
LPPSVPHILPPARRPILPVVLVALAVLGVGGGVVYLLRKPDTPLAPGGLIRPTFLQPAELGGLAFLPPASNVVFGVQPGPVLDHAKRTNQDPVALLTKAGVPTTALAALGQGGVSLDAIDHAAGGVFVPDSDLTTPRLVVSLHLRQPVPDEGKFLDALKARRPATGDPPHYAAEFAGLPVKLAKAADTVWLIGWSDRDVTPAGNGLPDRMRATLAAAFPPGVSSFALTDDADWARMKSVSLLMTAGGKADWLTGLAKVRAVAVGLNLADGPTVRVGAKGATPTARAELRDAFRRQPGTTGETGEWITLDTPADEADGLAELRRLFAPAK